MTLDENEIKLPKWVFPDKGDDYKEWISVKEFFKDADISYTSDWGNGSAIIISIEQYVATCDEETIINSVKQKLGLLP